MYAETLLKYGETSNGDYSPSIHYIVIGQDGYMFLTCHSKSYHYGTIHYFSSPIQPSAWIGLLISMVAIAGILRFLASPLKLVNFHPLFYTAQILLEGGQNLPARLMSKHALKLKVVVIVWLV